MNFIKRIIQWFTKKRKLKRKLKNIAKRDPFIYK
mgnify:CR=1 FL=1